MHVLVNFCNMYISVVSEGGPHGRLVVAKCVTLLK